MVVDKNLARSSTQLNSTLHLRGVPKSRHRPRLWLIVTLIVSFVSLQLPQTSRAQMSGPGGGTGGGGGGSTLGASPDCGPCAEYDWTLGDCGNLPAGTAVSDPCKECDGAGGVQDKPGTGGQTCTITQIRTRYSGKYCPISPIFDALDAADLPGLAKKVAKVIGGIGTLLDLIGLPVGAEPTCGEMPSCYLYSGHNWHLDWDSVVTWFDIGPAGGPDLSCVNVSYDIITEYKYESSDDPCCKTQTPSGGSCDCGSIAGPLVALPPKAP